MSQRIVASLGVVVVFLLGADAPSDAAKKDLAALQGEWKVEKAVRGGMAAPADVVEKLKLKFEGVKVVVDEGTARDEQAEVTLDPSKKPAAVDIVPTRPGKEIVKGIYKLDGDSLTMCWAKSGERPSEFASKEGTEVVLFVLKRVKK